MEFIFDIETSGLPKFSNDSKRIKNTNGLARTPSRFPSPDNFEAYNNSRIVSICWILIDKITKDIVQQEYYIIQPNGFVIPQEVINIHGLTNEFVNRCGIPINDMLERMYNAIKKVDTIVAYNIEFDYNIIKSELMRSLLDYIVIELDIKTQKCAMQMSQKHMKLNRFPKLADAHLSILGKPIVDAHNSIGDTISCLEIYKAILNLI